jgi:small-conductance mechanosensitive channel
LTTTCNMFSQLGQFFHSLNSIAQVDIILVVSVLLAIATRIILLTTLRISLKKKYPNLSGSIVKRLRLAVTLFFPVLYFNVLLHGNKGLEYYDQINQLIRIAFIISAAIIVISVANVMEDMLYAKFEEEQTDESEVKRVKSQVSFIKKLLVIFIVIVATALVLMSFEKVRELGTSILASAGIVGVILGFAAQKSIANLLAGVEIAFNHTLKIDDFVVVEQEYGRVEEISLTSVVVKLWDQRRMILPITYFTDRPFENWTRQNSDITMSIFMYLDYKIPINELKEKYREIVQECPLWDGNVCKLIITDFSEKTMQVRATASASGPDKAFELRAYLREKLIEYINERFPEYLPRVRMGELD